MKQRTRQIIPVTVMMVTFACIFVNCKFSFAENKNASKDSVTFGAEKKPDIKTTPQFESFKNVFADIAEKVVPTVVSITSTKIDTVIYQDPFSQFFGGSPFEEFFGAPGNRQPRSRQPQKQEQRRESGVGSGVIVSKDGYILTNYHVVGGADEIMVQTHDDKEYDAEIIGIDSLSDVAVIKLKEKVSDLPVAYIGNSESLRPGDWVMAVGNPFNLSSTVTTGIVSAIGRYSQGISTYQNFIQTDAAINPGNSGGALVNIEGELIGINTMIYTRSGGYMGIGFAIPISMAKDIMEQLIKSGKVSRGWLGVGISDIDQNMKDALGMKNMRGVLINEIYDDQPAKKAGIKIGDVIISIDGINTIDANSLRNTVASIKPGKKVPVTIMRNGKKISLEVTLASRDEKSVQKLSSKEKDTDGDVREAEEDLTKKLGFSIANLTREVKEQLGLNQDEKGVYVTSVEQNSSAARKGLESNCLIKKIKIRDGDFIEVTDVNSFKKIVKSVRKNDPIMLYVEKNGNLFFIAFRANG